MRQSVFTKALCIISILVLMTSCAIIFINDNPVEIAGAVPISQDESRLENVDSMKYGYNVTAGKSLLKDGLCKNEAILKPINEGLYKYIEKFENVSQLTAGSFSKGTTLEIAESYGQIINGGLCGSYGGKIGGVSLDFDTEFGIEKERHEVVDELFEVYYQRQPRVQYIIQDNVDLRDYISDSLKNDFKAVNNVNDATILLNKYGTHLFTGFTYGGLMQVCNYQSTKKVEENLSKSMTLSQKMDMRIAAFNGNENFSFEENFAKAERAGTRISKYTSTLYGGDGVTGATVDHLFSYVSGPLGEQGYFIYGKWVDSINDGKRLAIIDVPTSARAIPLWELLPAEPGFSTKRNTIIEAYALMCGDKYNEYCEKYPLVNRQLASTQEGENSGKINGYTLTYKGNTSFNESKNTIASVVGKGSIINMNYSFNGYQPASAKWKITNASVENIVDIIDAQKGVFKVKDTAANNATFTVELQDNNQLISNMYLDFKINTDPFSGGDGTPENPYVISTVEDLQTMSKDSGYWSKNFVLANNIDCKNANITGVGNYDTSLGFSGEFNGNYCTISNFNIVEPRGSAVGLFAYIEAKGVVKNLFVNNPNVRMQSKDNTIANAGIISGVNKGLIDNCKLTGASIIIQRETLDDVNNNYVLNVGTIAGKIEGEGKIKQCSVFNVSATGNEGKRTIASFVNKNQKGNITANVGGIVGCIDSSSKNTEKVMSNCYVNNLYDIKSNLKCYDAETNIGGVVGKITSDITLENIVVGNIQSIASGTLTVTFTKNLDVAIGKNTSATTCLNCIVQKHTEEGVSNNSKWVEKEVVDGSIISSHLSNPAWNSIDNNFPILVQQTFDPNNALFVAPNKTEYYFGEEFDVSGIKVKGKQQFSDNMFDIKYYVVDSSNYNKNAKGGYKIIIKALGYETSYDVKVRDIKVIGLSLKLKKETVYYNDTINRDDYTIGYILENGDIVDVNGPYLDNVLYPTKNPDLDIKFKHSNSKYVLGDNEIAVEINNLTAKLVVKAIENDVVKIELQTNPLKSSYNVGEVFDPTGMEVKATYTDNSTEIVPNDKLEIMGENISVGENSIVMSYGKYKTCNYVVTGNDVEYTVKFNDDDGTELSNTIYHYGNQVLPPEDPVKASDNTYSYKFIGWDKPITSCKGDKVYTAVYKKEFIEYKVEFKNDDGTILSSRTYHYGDNIIVPDNPIKAADNKYTYTFKEWNNKVVPCAGDTTYIAVYNSTYIDYTVTFKDENGTLLNTSTYHYGDKVIPPTEPTKQQDNTYTYTFNGWDNNVVNCFGDAVYTAVYRATFIEYKVEFKNDDGTILSTMYYHYGDTVIEPSNVYKPSDAYSYEFIGWDKPVTTCKGNASYIATYKQIEREFVVKFLNHDGTLISSAKYHYGDAVTAPENVKRADTVEYTYTFIGWDKDITNCNGDAVYNAVYKQVAREYVVTFVNDDDTVLSSKTYKYGDQVIPPKDPSKQSNETNIYTFSGWDQTVTNCLGDAKYKATYEATLREYEIVFKNDDGTIISKNKYHYGDKVIEPTEVIKLSDVYKYTFTGWDKAVVDCVGDATYFAQYDKKFIDYRVIFQNDNGTVISSTTYHYGDKVELPPSPIKEADKQYTYVFSNWDKPITSCTSDITYTAVYNKTYIEYKVRFLNWDGSIISEEVYHYNDIVSTPTNPERPKDDKGEYEFTGWDKPVDILCEGDSTYIAQYQVASIGSLDSKNEQNTKTGLTKQQKLGIGLGVPASTIVVVAIILVILNKLGIIFIKKKKKSKK